MKKSRWITGGKIGFALCTALLGAVTGCVGYVDRPGHGEVYVQPPPDDYVYYPVTRSITAATDAITYIGKAVPGYRDPRRRASRLTCCLRRRR